MSLVFNMVGGGGGDDTYAFIVVTYPAGSTCTASDGTTTLTAPDASGSCVYKVQNAGTWTVSCTDGTDTASATVNITTEGQSESVALRYSLYIIKDGVILIQPQMGLAATVLTQESEDVLLTESANNVFSFIKLQVNDGVEYSSFNLNLEKDSSAILYNQSPGIGYSLSDPTMNTGTGLVSPLKAYTPLTSETGSNRKVSIPSAGSPYVVSIGSEDRGETLFVWLASGGGSGYKGAIYIKDLWLSR